MPYYQKYRKYQEQVSYDQGVTWEYVYPAHYATSGDPLERYDTLEECEMKKFILTLLDSSIASGDCDSTSAITSEEISAYTDSVVSVQIGDCVSTIGNNAFKYCFYLTDITIPDNVTTIGEGAFYYCYPSLTSVTIGNGVTTIGKNAFIVCRNLSTLTIGNSVTTIGEGAFQNCEALTSITIPYSVTTIGDDAFGDCLYATSLTIGSGVTNIGDGAFGNTVRLQSITINATTPPTLADEYEFYDSNCPIFVPCESVNAYKTAWSTYADRIQCKVEGKVKLNLNNSSSVTISCDATSAITSGEVATRYSGTTKTVYVGDCVKTIGDYGFYKCSSLKEVILPNTITNIETNAFAQCSSLSSITIPNSVTTINDYAFYNSELNSVIRIPSGVTSTHNYTFMYSRLTGVEFPNTLTYIGVSSFASCNRLTNVTIPSSVTIIGDGAFQSCGALSSVTISNSTSVQAIGDKAFWNCDALSSITIPNSVGYIGESAFTYSDNLTSVNLPNGNNGFTALNNSAFLGCKSLTSITIPDSVTTIGDVVFDGCSGLTSAVIGNGITSIGYSAFRNCKKLTGITINAIVPPTLDSNVFYGTNNCPIYVPCESVDVYRSSWSTYADRIQCVPVPFEGKYKFTLDDSSIVSGVCDSSSEISGSVVDNYRNSIISAIIGDCVTSIYQSTFQNCGKLAYLSLGNGVTYIGMNAFNGCTALTNVTIPDNVTTIGDWAFSYCSELTSVTIEEGVEIIGWCAFNNCTNLTGITINAVTPPTLGSDAFGNTNNCPIYVPCESVSAYKTAWSEYASRITCIKLTLILSNKTTVTIPSDSSSAITRNNVSAYSASVVSAVIGGCVTSISANAFKGCKYLANVNIPSGVTSIGNYAFSGCTGLTCVASMPSTPPTLGTNVFTSTNDCPIYVGGVVDTYKAASGWSDYSSRIKNGSVIPSGLRGKWSFSVTSGSTTVTVSAPCESNSAITSSEVIEYKDNAKTMTAGSCAKEIDSYAFRNFTGLTGAIIGTNVTNIGNEAFKNCSQLNYIRSYPRAKVPVIGIGVFDNTNNCPIIVPLNKFDEYRLASGWIEYASRIRIYPN